MAEFFAALREFRRPIALIAVGLVLLQSLLVMLSGAQAAARLAPDAFGVICHGNGSLGQDGGDTNPGAKAAHDCCVVCTATWAATSPPRTTGRLERIEATHSSMRHERGTAVPLEPRAVRSGLSQAPPTLG